MHGIPRMVLYVSITWLIKKRNSKVSSSTKWVLLWLESFGYLLKPTISHQARLVFCKRLLLVANGFLRELGGKQDAKNIVAVTIKKGYVSSVGVVWGKDTGTLINQQVLKILCKTFKHFFSVKLAAFLPHTCPSSHVWDVCFYNESWSHALCIKTLPDPPPITSSLLVQGTSFNHKHLHLLHGPSRNCYNLVLRVILIIQFLNSHLICRFCWK